VTAPVPPPLKICMCQASTASRSGARAGWRGGDCSFGPSAWHGHRAETLAGTRGSMTGTRTFSAHCLHRHPTGHRQKRDADRTPQRVLPSLPRSRAADPIRFAAPCFRRWGPRALRPGGDPYPHHSSAVRPSAGGHSAATREEFSPVLRAHAGFKSFVAADIGRW